MSWGECIWEESIFLSLSVIQNQASKLSFTKKNNLPHWLNATNVYFKTSFGMAELLLIFRISLKNLIWMNLIQRQSSLNLVRSTYQVDIILITNMIMKTLSVIFVSQLGILVNVLFNTQISINKTCYRIHNISLVIRKDDQNLPWLQISDNRGWTSKGCQDLTLIKEATPSDTTRMRLQSFSQHYVEASYHSI